MPEPPSSRVRDLGYEPSDVSVRWVLIAAVGGLLFVALAGAALYGLQRLYATIDVAEEPAATALERRQPEPPAPRLEADPAESLAAHEERESVILDTYGWVDQEAGIARIPIEQAMRLLAERGWPQPASGPRPPPEAAQGLQPWPDWQAPP